MQPLRELMVVIGASLPAVLNIFSLLTLVFFIYAILGSFIFYDIPHSAYFDDYTNFSNFGMAMMLLLRICTGEQWNAIMYDAAKDKGLLVSVLYFCSFISINGFIMLNLFIMIIVQAYQDHVIRHCRHARRPWPPLRPR